jgi:ubiquinone/menaquinone biosynthesis C-methylase UbiE
VCCGTCNFADLAKGEYIGVDLNQKYLAYARNKYRSDAAKKFIVADINDIKFAPKYFDNVFLISALHHLSDESAMRILEKVNKAAKGKIIISDPSIETSSPISKFLIFLDRGKFIRSLKDALSLISRSLTVIEYFTFYTGLAHKFIVVCQPRDT